MAAVQSVAAERIRAGQRHPAERPASGMRGSPEQAARPTFWPERERRQFRASANHRADCGDGEDSLHKKCFGPMIPKYTMSIKLDLRRTA